MSKTPDLLTKELKVINLGLRSFHEALLDQGVPAVHTDWKPPAGGKKEIMSLLQKLEKMEDKIEAANKEALQKLQEANPVLVGVGRAIDVIPGMEKNLILHAGPPISWEKMAGPVKGAVMGALVYEGLAKDVQEAEELAKSGKIKFDPCHHHNTVGPMAGVVSASMYVFTVKNTKHGNVAYSTMNEGLGKVLRFGAYSSEVIDRLKWMENILAPSLKKALELKPEGINLKSLTAQALMMGDECHNRNVAGTSLFLREITPSLLATDCSKETLKEVFEFISGNNHFFLNLSMAACKAICDTIKDQEYSTVMYGMARNGTEIGIRIAGLGDMWFTAPAGRPRGLYFSGYGDDDACLDLGDSTISETAGIGGFAMACAPAIVKFVGGAPADAVRYTKQMGEICIGRHRDYQMPPMDFLGAPVGVDIRKTAESGITPIINTGIAHKDPGVGQVGAGILFAPVEMFENALKAFAEKYSA
ncbi:MAG: DUF1116 domain-containing protein [Firmicutes bacterium]|nr:DUF1116 domain-containing protein [Bacillota bacterium]